VSYVVELLKFGMTPDEVAYLFPNEDAEFVGTVLVTAQKKISKG